VIANYGTSGTVEIRGEGRMFVVLDVRRRSRDAGAEGSMNRLRQLLASARSAWAKFDADITVWNRVVHGIGAAEPVQVERRQAARRGFGGRRSTDMFRR